MRYIIHIFFLLSSGIGGATVIAPVSVTEYIIPRQGESVEAPNVQGGFFQLIAEKAMPERLEKRIAASDNAHGLWLSIFGVFFGVMGILPYVISIELGLYLFIPLAILGLIGLPLSILGLRKARRWSNNGFVKGMAIAGIILNGLLFLGGIVALALIAGGFDLI